MRMMLVVSLRGCKSIHVSAYGGAIRRLRQYPDFSARRKPWNNSTDGMGITFAPSPDSETQ